MRLLFVDDHLLVREALTYFLHTSAPDSIIVEASDVSEAISRFEGDAYDLILLDYRLPGVSGVNAIGALKQCYPQTPIVVLSGAITHEEANGALDLGVSGVISKSIKGNELWATIQAHLDGDSSISREIRPAPGAPGQAEMTRRELQVSALLVQGMNNKEIANELGLAEITIRLHVRQILRKLGARSRTDAVRIMVSAQS